MTERRIKTLMLWTDIGFLAYWIATAAGLLSVGEETFLKQWNWSFIAVDLGAIAAGLASVWLTRRRRGGARELMVISLSLTAAAGLMALNFWAIRCEFDPAWWLPNLWLALFPVVALTLLLRRGPTHTAPV